MSIEAMKQALEACERLYVPEFTQDDSPINNCIKALRQAIEEEALRNVQRIGQEIEQDWSTQAAALESLREHMARIKELEAQIEQMKKQEPNTLAYREAARLAEWLFKKHYAHEEHYAFGQVIWGPCDTTAGVISQIDNMVCQLVQAEKQEPVAWRTFDGEGGFDYRNFEDNERYKEEYIERNGDKYKNWVEPIYTHPQPKREPLTDEQILSFVNAAPALNTAEAEWLHVARAIEAAHGIKEKNT